MRHQISVAANANKVLEAQIADLERRIEETDAAISSEQDPAVLNRRNTDWHLGLVPPGETQVRRICRGHGDAPHGHAQPQTLRGGAGHREPPSRPGALTPLTPHVEGLHHQLTESPFSRAWSWRCSRASRQGWSGFT
jgi:hypothetical protein